MATDEMTREHQRFFRGFVKFAAYSCAATAIALGLMAIFLL